VSRQPHLITGEGVTHVPELSQRRRQITGDTAFVVGAQVVGLVVTLLATPVQLSRMGYERYGLVALAVAVVGIFNFLDLGLSWSALRHLPTFRRHETAGLAEDAASLLVSSALTLGLAVSTVAVATACVLYALSAAFLGLDREHFAIVLVSAALLPALMTSNVLSSVARAFGQFRSAAVISAGYFVGTNLVWVAAAGRPADVEIVIAAQVVFCILSSLIWLRRIRGAGLRGLRVRLGMRSAFEQHKRELLVFAFFAAFGGLATNLLTTADKLAFAAGIGVGQLPLYTISAALCSRLAIVAMSLTAVVFPRLSSAHAAEDDVEYASLSRWAMHATVLCTAVVAAALFWAGDDFVSIWISPSFAHRTSLIIKLLTIGFAVWSVGQLGYAANDARGGVRRTMVSGVFFAMLGLVGAALVSARSGISAGAGIFAAALVVNGVVGLVLGYGRVRLTSAASALWFCAPAFAAVGLMEWIAHQLDAGPLLAVAVAVVASTSVLAAQAWIMLRRRSRVVTSP
jgi:O-antigen/teichoic acid export membrane protein